MRCHLKIGTVVSAIAAWMPPVAGWHLLDSGALCRAVGSAGGMVGLDLSGREADTRCAETTKIRFRDPGDGGETRVIVSSHDATDELRTETAADPPTAANCAVSAMSGRDGRQLHAQRGHYALDGVEARAGVRAQRAVERFPRHAGSLGHLRHATRTGHRAKRARQCSRVVFLPARWSGIPQWLVRYPDVRPCRRFSDRQVWFFSLSWGITPREWLGRASWLRQCPCPAWDLSPPPSITMRTCPRWR
jgi:hypothetical protein